MSEFATAYGPKKKVVTVNNKPSMTKEAYAEMLDVNRIIANHARVDLMAASQSFEAVYGEFTSMDLRDAIETVEKANDLFMRVPSKVRANFDNDAGAFIDYASNPANVEQMRQWGLAKLPEPPQEPIQVSVVSPPGGEGQA